MGDLQRVTENIGARLPEKKDASKARVALGDVANNRNATRNPLDSMEEHPKKLAGGSQDCQPAEQAPVSCVLNTDSNVLPVGGSHDEPSCDDDASNSDDEGSCLESDHYLPELEQQYSEMSISEDYDLMFGLRHIVPEGVHDIDLDDQDNPQLVAEYTKDIYIYLFKVENEYKVRPKHMDAQSEVNSRMRAVLIDWLFQVSLRFKLLQETMYLAINILDRYLQDNTVAKKELQLVGVASLLIASKFEEMYVPEVSDYVYVTDRAYTKPQILATEANMLKALGFNFCRPYPLHFLRRFSKAWEVEASKHTMAKYFMMVTQTEYCLAHVEPSRLAAAAICLAAKLEGVHWDATAKFYSCYCEAQLKPVMCVMATVALQNYLGTTKFKAIARYFQQEKLMSVSVSELIDSPIMREYSSLSADMADKL